MKKFVSLLLALALCLCLAVPALASGHELYIEYTNGEMDALNDSGSGSGWSYDSNTNTLTLNGLKDANIFVSELPQGLPTIVLAPGSKNVLTGITADSLSDSNGYEITIKGTGELIVYDAAASEHGVFRGFSSSVKLLDGLTMTGGTKEGDNGALAFKAFPDEDRTWYTCMAGNQPATYIRIAPTAPAKPSITGFTDVAANSTFEEPIKWAVDNGITTGITATTFGPGNTCTVKHILTFLWRANGRPGDNGNESAAVAAWAADALGVDASSTSAPCTRALAVTYMWKAAGSPSASASSFTDVPASADYAQAVNWAVEKGITSGTSATTFAPNNTCTRGQIVTFLYRASK